MKKNPAVALGLQALAFSMKGAAATKAEQHALEDAARACDGLALSASTQLVKIVALECAAANPLTDAMTDRLRAAVDALPRPATALEGSLEFGWQRRKDLA